MTHRTSPHHQRHVPTLCGRQFAARTTSGTDQVILHAFASPVSEQGDLAELRDHLLIAISRADISGFEGTKQALIAILKHVEEEL